MAGDNVDELGTKMLGHFYDLFKRFCQTMAILIRQVCRTSQYLLVKSLGHLKVRPTF
jgi:hypothetical protein